MSNLIFETTGCLVCGSPESSHLLHVRDWAYDLPGEFNLVTCQVCKHVYQSPRLTQVAIKQHYPDNYEPFRRVNPRDDGRWSQVLQHLQWRARCLQVVRLRRSGRLLDVGCSTGVFLDEMKHYGEWIVTGLEPNANAAQYARDSLGLDVFNGQLEQAPWSPHSFDLVTLWDVLEHLPNPREALSKIHDLLTPGGYLIASVPNGSSVDARLFGPYWIGLDAPRHLSVFKPDTLKRLFQVSGFKVEALYCFYGRYTTFALSIRQGLRAHLPRSRARDALEWVLFLPFWRYATFPYFWLVDQWQRGAILTVRAKA